VTSADNYQPLPEAQVARRVGFPNYDTPVEIQTLQAMIQQPPFPGQSNYAELAAFLNDKVKRLAAEVGSPEDVIQRRQDIVNSGLADWKIHFELAVLNQRLGNSSAMYYHLDKVLELYPHNRETYIKIAEAKSKEGQWREVIPYLQRSLYYTRGDETKIAETIGWLGIAYLRTGEYEEATNLLLEVTEKYPDQTDLVLSAYGNLVRYSRAQGKDRDLARYIEDVQRYARSLIQSGKDKEYPLLNQKVSQILALGGYNDEAREWAEAKQQ
jgi:tetratricopeptide (TPR) repeat protein